MIPPCISSRFRRDVVCGARLVPIVYIPIPTEREKKLMLLKFIILLHIIL